MDGFAAPTTLLEAVAFFSDAERAHQYAVLMRWPNGIACPRMGCGSASVQTIATRKLWRCKECKRQFSVRVGSVFEDSPIPFTKWLPAFWLLANTKNGTSSCELARAIGVSQKTAWFMFHRIREAMGTTTFESKLRGEVEVDETYIGGKLKNVGRVLGRKRRGPQDGKTTVLGMIERGGRVRAMVVPGQRANVLVPRVLDNVEPRSTVYTDALMSYDSLASWGYEHEVINHAVEYVRGRVHTNNIENFWACLKRTLGGTYIAARSFHLDAYLDEQAFRFNARHGNDAARFVATLKGADGKRLTYAALTTSHPRWRALPSAPVAVRRRKVEQAPISGVSDRV